jgi:hypothetical protein
MKKLFLTGILFTAVLVAFFEVFLRITGLASDVMDRQLTNDKILVFKPGSEGFRTRGMRAEVNARYHINKQGWNSTKNYDTILEKSIAVVGDSYIAGLWNNVDSTVASLLELKLKADSRSYTQVHSYGHPGANYRDYLNLIPYLENKGYSKIYIYVNVKDFFAKKPSLTNVSSYSGRQGIQFWYRKSALLKYLNVNLSVQNLLSNNKEKNDKDKTAKKAQENEMMIYNGVKSQSSTVVRFFYDDPFFDTLNLPMVKVIHKRLPYDHGFNGHWNVNGNRNAAEAIFLDLIQNR